jgi:hypothetical protein
LLPNQHIQPAIDDKTVADLADIKTAIDIGVDALAVTENVDEIADDKAVTGLADVQTTDDKALGAQPDTCLAAVLLVAKVVTSRAAWQMPRPRTNGPAKGLRRTRRRAQTRKCLRRSMLASTSTAPPHWHSSRHSTGLQRSR